MRTTLTLEPDVAAEIERRRRERGTTLKQEVNEALRRGLRADGEPKRERYVTKTWDMGPPLVPLDDIHDALVILEGEDYK